MNLTPSLLPAGGARSPSLAERIKLAIGEKPAKLVDAEGERRALLDRHAVLFDEHRQAVALHILNHNSANAAAIKVTQAALDAVEAEIDASSRRVREQRERYQPKFRAAVAPMLPPIAEAIDGALDPLREVGAALQALDEASIAAGIETVGLSARLAMLPALTELAEELRK